MKAVVCRALGIEHAALEDVAPPPLTADGVRIRVASAGVSFANLLVIEGKHQNRRDPPFTPGTEVAGTVVECGPDVRVVKAGDRVVAGTRSGGFADEVVAPESNVFRLPDQVGFDAAVHFPTIYGAAFGALAWRASLGAGETLLVHGAAGGSGLAAIEIGVQLGARVVAVAATDAKIAAVREHGAHEVIDTRAGGFRDAVLALTDGRGADVIFDPVGGGVFDESLRCIAPEGRLIPMGFASGSIPSVPANLILVKNVTVIGIYWGYYMGWARHRPPPSVPPKVRAAFDQLLTWTVEGRLRPRTWRAYRLAAFRDALAAISGRDVIGRVVLNP